MEGNNHFNFGGLPSVSANSGLKLSSGDSLYTNGSSTSFPLQGKNMNGDMNVNGITTVIGTSTSGSQPPPAYSLASSHNPQGSMGYDYVWGHSQYGPTSSSGSGAGPHHKQGHGAAVQQPQHFLSHEQYLMNGGLTGSRQPPVAAPPNVTLTGGQYWNTGSPSPQPGGANVAASYNSKGVYGAYQTPVHPSMPPTHQQQQQHQPLQHQQQPQQRHYSMAPNGISYYQHRAQPQSHPPTQTSSQHPSTAQAQSQPASAKNFTPPGLSPLHHTVSQTGTGTVTGSPKPLQNVLNGGPKMQENSLVPRGMLPAGGQGHLNEMEKDSAYMERPGVAQLLPEAEVVTLKSSALPAVPPCPSDVGQPMNNRSQDGELMRNPAPRAVSPITSAPPLARTAASTQSEERASSEASMPSGSEEPVCRLSATERVPFLEMAAKSGPAVLNSQSKGSDATVAGQQEHAAPANGRTMSFPGVQSSKKFSLAGRIPELASGVSERNDGPPKSGSTGNTADCPSLAESSYIDSSGAGEASALEGELNDEPSPDSSSVTEGSTGCLFPVTETGDLDTSQLEETASSMEDSAEGPSLKLTPRQESSLKDPGSSVSFSSTFDNVVSQDLEMETQLEERKGPAAPGGAGATRKRREREAASRLTAPPPANGAAALRAGNHAGDLAFSTHDLQYETSVEEGGVDTTEEGAEDEEELRPVDEGMTGAGKEADKRDSPKNAPTYHKGPVCSSLKRSPSRSPAPLQVKPKKAKRVKKLAVEVPQVPKVELLTEEDENENDMATGEVQRRRIASEEEVRFPLLHGWRREIRVRRSESRLKGETWYYSPCGKRMKQFPEVIKYLSRHQGTAVSREHFSFSPRMPVGDFYEERETAEGLQWFLLADEEVPSMIMAITGRRGRPPNPDRVPSRSRGCRNPGAPGRRPGRPPKTKMVDLLSKVDARLLKRLQTQDALTEEDKEKLNKIKKKMKRKARTKRKEDAMNKKARQEKRKAKLEKAKEVLEPEKKAETPHQSSPYPSLEPKKPGRWRRLKAEETAEGKGKLVRVRRESGARGKAKAQAQAQAEAEVQAQTAAAASRQAVRRAQAQRRQEERRRHQQILEELKKPTEDMCITEHQPLPGLSRIPGVVLSGQAFSHCLMVLEFLHSYGKVLGLQVSRDVPSLSSLQAGLLGVDENQGEVLDLLVKLVQAALRDPGLPSHYQFQSLKLLGEKLVELELNRSSVSEALRIFLEMRGFKPQVCDSLRTKPFKAHPPDTKAAVLAFLVDELNGSNIVISEIDKTLEKMATFRKNKWIIEGKLRRLKAALARRTGRSEAELCLEERRRSARVAEEESLGLEENVPLERSSRRARKEEAKLSEGESPSTASIPELERQIDKLTKRQVFFRKKLQQSSHSLRAVSLGQDRYRRRYWVLPQIATLLVEGPEEILASADVLVKEEDPVPSPVKKEPASESPVSPVAPQHSPPEDHPLPGTVSLMSSPRARGRPRKIKPEVELHLRTAKIRRRQRSSKAAGEECAYGVAVCPNGNDFTQSAFLSWLSQSQHSFTNGACGDDGQEGNGIQQDSVKEMAEKRGQWFNLLPKVPCDLASLSQPLSPNSQPKDSPCSPGILASHGASSLQPSQPFLGSAISPQVCSTPLQKPGRRRRRGSGLALTPTDPTSLGFSLPGAGKRRGRPPSKLLQQIEQKYFTQLTAQPIPAGMVRGWWWIRRPEELTAILQALHPRGIREKALHKHLSKHWEYLEEVCAGSPNDPVFQQKVEAGDALSQVLQKPWEMAPRAMETDISVLQWVEDLEQRVLTADLQLKVPKSGSSDTDSSFEVAAPGAQAFVSPEPDSTRDDLEYYEHTVNPLDDWTVKTKKEWSDLLRVPTNPLDLAVMRLAALERNIERRYLKEPLWIQGEVMRLAPLTPLPGEENLLDMESVESEITPRIRVWRQAVDRCRSAAQLSLCLLQLERAIAWERSVVKVTCQVCRKGDNDEYLLLCDCCDQGCHMYCLRPKITRVPEGDWFCPACLSKADGDSPRLRRNHKQKGGASKRHTGSYSSGSSDEDRSPWRGAGGVATRQREGQTPSKRRRMATRNQPDLTYCEIILMEMESHTDAWPFLEPVNPRLVPGYRRIIKNPMDFLTMRERLLQGGYCSCEEFAADAQLVFDNCQLFNEDMSEVGMAGHAMRRFFQSRWSEFYQNRGEDK